jgi:3-deoxy-D-arabino-heptulosonate 7-phosphate (DAHP) synthase
VVRFIRAPELRVRAVLNDTISQHCNTISQQYNIISQHYNTVSQQYRTISQQYHTVSQQIHGQNLALTVLYVPCSLHSGPSSGAWVVRGPEQGNILKGFKVF